MDSSPLVRQRRPVLAAAALLMPGETVLASGTQGFQLRDMKAETPNRSELRFLEETYIRNEDLLKQELGDLVGKIYYPDPGRIHWPPKRHVHALALANLVSLSCKST